MKRKGMVLGLLLVGLVHFQSGQPIFDEYATNPVFAPGRAYYPTVVFDPDHFGDSYAVVPYFKMWYTSAAGIAMAYSEDGITWTQYGPVSGLLGSAHHAHVIYDRNGFGGTAVHYKMWFWDTDHLYSLAALKYAESSDGINWTWSSLTQDAVYPLVTGVSPDWNRGSYGPIDVFYHSTGSAVLDDTAVWNNRYVMYYDGTTGGIEQVGLAYSADGLHWKRYLDQPVLPVTPGAWDSNYVGFGTVINLSNQYHFFYSGGKSAMNEGIGYAFSEDGITWQKASSPIFHKTDGVLWRSVRCYTPSVLVTTAGNRVCFDVWFTGDDGSNRAIGYARGCMSLPVFEVERSRNADRETQQQMVSLARFNFKKCCEENEKIVSTLLDTLKADEDTPEYKKALELIEKARNYCQKSQELTTSGNAVAGNYCALQSCTLYEEALYILRKMAADAG